MGYRSRLVVAALTTALSTVALGLLAVVPVVNSLRDRLQDRYDADAPIPEAARLVGAERAQQARRRGRRHAGRGGATSDPERNPQQQEAHDREAQSPAGRDVEPHLRYSG